MNTGLQDVWNLAWKIDLGARGHGSEELLNSYTTERRPVIKHVIDITDFMTKAMGTPSKFAQALRNTVIPVVSRLAPFQHAFVQTLSELGVAYGGSPIVEGAGKRYFDDSMRGGNGILSRFLLLCGSDAASETTACYVFSSSPGISRCPGTRSNACSPRRIHRVLRAEQRGQRSTTVGAFIA
jgi:hypothetical protein